MLAAAVVGTSHSRSVLRNSAAKSIVARKTPTQCKCRRCARAGHRRARHLVLVGTAAVFCARLAGEDALTSPRSIPRHTSDHRLRHPVLLGGAHDHDEQPLHATAIPRATFRSAPCTSRTGARRRPPEDVKDHGQRAWTPSRSSRSTAPMRCASTTAAMVAPAVTSTSARAAPQSYRAFACKIWNAARFLFMECG